MRYRMAVHEAGPQGISNEPNRKGKGGFQPTWDSDQHNPAIRTKQF